MQKPLGFAYARPLGPSARPIAVSDRGYSVGQTTLPTRMGAHDRTCYALMDTLEKGRYMVGTSAMQRMETLTDGGLSEGIPG